MIKIDKIEITEFRGIRNHTLEPKNANFAVCGRNGTGKSGVVDAIEFALTGNISRLSGKGTGEVSVKDHAPHVDSRNRPDKAKVKVWVSIPSLGKQATIERTVSDLKNPSITPADNDVKQVFEMIGNHPEFVLSRRELIKYILATPGDRSDEVQSLLRLNLVEDIRSALKKIANSEKKEVAILEREKQNAKNELIKALDISDLDSEKLLDAVNIRRKTLKLPDISELKSDTSIKDGVESLLAQEQKEKLPKEQSLISIKSIRESLILLKSDGIKDGIITIIAKINDLSSNPAVSKGIDREKFLNIAISLIDEDVCPVCGLEWNQVKLKKVMNYTSYYISFE